MHLRNSLSVSDVIIFFPLCSSLTLNILKYFTTLLLLLEYGNYRNICLPASWKVLIRNDFSRFLLDHINICLINIYDVKLRRLMRLFEFFWKGFAVKFSWRQIPKFCSWYLNRIIFIHVLKSFISEQNFRALFCRRSINFFTFFLLFFLWALSSVTSLLLRVNAFFVKCKFFQHYRYHLLLKLKLCQDQEYAKCPIILFHDFIII